ncbi:MAG: gliding motility-associated C-terminal domain-containing protein [Bacteroidota bacterium]|nr:gliding motility-associated C-terminal domain-containing protein [Bacteroidota bacterium]
MTRNWVLLFFSILQLELLSQNLIPNSSFELCQKCDGRGFKELSINEGANDPIDWTAATWGTPDIYSLSPKTGRRHGGFFLGFPKYEYMVNHFTEPLIAGNVYTFRFSIKPDFRNVNYAIDQIGIYIQSGNPIYPQAEPLAQLIPQFETPEGEFITKDEYREYSFDYIACGGEDHFIVGRFNFLGVGDTLFIGTKRPSNIKSTPVYYLMDDFSMVLKTTLDLLPNEMTVCPGNEYLLELDSSLHPISILWSTGETTRMIKRRGAGYVWVEFMFSNNCPPIRDSIHIIEKILPHHELSPDKKEICIGDEIQLKVTTCVGCNNTKWDNGSIGNDAIYKDPGIHFVSSEWECGVTTDSFTIELKEEKIADIISFPNVISTNGETENQAFAPLVKQANRILAYHLTIFNRWGEKIFETKELTSKWIPEDFHSMETYLYIAEVNYQDCNKISTLFLKGDVSLVR